MIVQVNIESINDITEVRKLLQQGYVVHTFISDFKIYKNMSNDVYDTLEDTSEGSTGIENIINNLYQVLRQENYNLAEHVYNKWSVQFLEQITMLASRFLSLLDDKEKGMLLCEWLKSKESLFSGLPNLTLIDFIESVSCIGHRDFLFFLLSKYPVKEDVHLKKIFQCVAYSKNSQLFSELASIHPLIIDSCLEECLLESMIDEFNPVWDWLVSNKDIEWSYKNYLYFREATYYNNTRIMNFYIDYISDINSIPVVSDIFSTMCGNGNLAIAKKFQSKFNIDITQNTHHAFTRACEKNQVSIVQWLSSLDECYYYELSNSTVINYCVRPKIIYRQLDFSEDCWICYSQEINMMTPCGHLFCEDCLRSYLKTSKSNTCPFCRQVISTVYLTKIVK